VRDESGLVDRGLEPVVLEGAGGGEDREGRDGHDRRDVEMERVLPQRGPVAQDEAEDPHDEEELQEEREIGLHEPPVDRGMAPRPLGEIGDRDPEEAVGGGEGRIGQPRAVRPRRTAPARRCARAW
jgi:hypothetical protein